MWSRELDDILLLQDAGQQQDLLRLYRAAGGSGNPHVRTAIQAATGRATMAGSVVPTKQESQSLSVPHARFRRQHTDEEWLKQVKLSDLLQVPLQRLAKDVAAVPWHVWRIGDPGPDGKPEREPVLHHRLLDIWTRPNPHMTGTQFRKLCVIYHVVSGCVPIRVFYGSDGLPQSLWPFPRNHVIDMPVISNPPRCSDRPYWTIRWRGHEEKIPPECMIWITEPDPEDPYGWGAGQVECLRHVIRNASYMDQWSANFFRNGAHLDKIIGIPGLNEDNIDAFTQDFEANHTSIDTVGRPFFVKQTHDAHAISVVDMSKGHRELDYVESQGQNAARGRHVLGTPPELVGDVTNSNRATADAADRIQQKNNVRPELLFLAEMFQVWLVPLYHEPDLLLEPEECVKETAEQRHLFAQDGAKGGMITRDEWRAAHGMKLLGGDTGRQIVFPVNVAFMDAAGGPIITAYPVRPMTVESPEGTEETAPQDGEDAAPESPAPPAKKNGKAHLVALGG